MGFGAALRDRLTRFWTYRWRVTVDGQDFDVRLACHWTRNVFTIAAGGRDIAADTLRTFKEDLRVQVLAVPTPGGELRFETAAHSAATYGLRVSRDADVVFQSHDDPFRMHAKLGAFNGRMKAIADEERRTSGWSVKPFVVVDIALAILLYGAAQFTSLRNVALIGAAAGFVIIVAQWLLDRVGKRRLDLTGGVSALAIPMLMLSAGFAWAFESDLAHQLKPTALGLASATLLGIDAALGGRFLGRAMAGCVPFLAIDQQRIAMLSAMVAAAMAALNGAIVFGLSKDVWLVYKFWIQPVLGLALGLWTLSRARLPAASPAP